MVLEPHVKIDDMNILVVGGFSSAGEERQMKEYETFYSDALAAQGVTTDVRFCYLDDLLFWSTTDSLRVFDTRNQREVQDDLVIFRGKIRAYSFVAYCMSKYLKLKNIQFFNNYEDHRGPFTKVGQTMVMHEMKLPHAATLYCANQAILLQKAKDYLSFPIIAKDILGAHGLHNHLVESHEELAAIFDSNPDVSFLLQEYIPNDCDYRILVVGDKELIIQRKSEAGSHLNNTSQGGAAKLVPAADFPAAVIKMAHEFARSLDMEIAGVDVMENKETRELIFLEINSQPQIATGAFTEEKSQIIGEFLANKRKKS